MNAEAHHMSDLFVTYTVFPTVKPTMKTERADVPWEEFVARVFNAPTYIAKSACPLVSFTEYGDQLTEAGCIRHAANAKRVYGCELDYDGEQMSIQQAASLLEQQRIEAVLYTSPSHKPDAPRWRAIFPFAEPYAPEQRADFLGRANRILGGIASRESFALSQSFYVGRVGGVEYVALQTHGRCIDAAMDIEPLYPVGTATPDEPGKRDETPDRALIATIRHEDGGIDGLSRYAAMVKLAARLVCRDLDDDDAESIMHEVLGDSPSFFHSTGGDPHKAVRSLVQSARRKFGDPRRKPIKETAPNPDAGPAPAGVDPETGEVGAPKSARRPMRWTELHRAGEPPKRTWLIRDWLTTGPTLLAGRGGVGKTLVAQTIATALALGRNYLDFVAAPHKVLMWACEDEFDELWRRQIAICRYFGVELSDLEGRLIIEPRLGLDNTLMETQYGKAVWTPLRDELAAQVKDYGADVLFLDNIGQTFGANENARHDATAYMNGMAGVAKSSIILGHPAKAADSEFSGSTAWENAVRMRWYLGFTLPDQEEGQAGAKDPSIRYICKRKQNYSQEDQRRLEWQDGIFVPEGKIADTHFKDRYGSKHLKEDAEKCIIDAVDRFASTGRHVSSSPQAGDRYICNRMESAGLADGFKRKDLKSAVERLLLAGRLVEIPVGKRANRSGDIMGLMLPGSAS